MPFFSELVPQAKTLLLEAGFAEETPAPSFLSREGENGNRLESTALRHPNRTVLKSCSIIGPRAEILFLMIYPGHTEITPVFALEYIALGGKPFLAVLDLQPIPPRSPVSEQIKNALLPSFTAFQTQLTDGGEKPAWAQTYFSPVAIHSRPLSVEEVPPLLQAYTTYLQAWRSLFSPEKQEHGQDALQVYLDHHFTHTPGRPFLTKIFGGEWTEAYLRDFIYAR